MCLSQGEVATRRENLSSNEKSWVSRFANPFRCHSLALLRRLAEPIDSEGIDWNLIRSRSNGSAMTFWVTCRGQPGGSSLMGPASYSMALATCSCVRSNIILALCTNRLSMVTHSASAAYAQLSNVRNSG